MSDIRDELTRVTNDLAATEQEIARLNARADGLRAERDSLARAIASMDGASAVAGQQDVAAMVKADAIVAVLRSAKPRTLRTAGIVDALHKAGRPAEVSQNVSVYLDALLKQGRVVRVARGEYTAPD